MKIDYEEVVNELKDWLEKNKFRNQEWINFMMDNGVVAIPIGYILNKIEDLESQV